jgi:ATP-binding cassette subfamily B protein
VVLLDPRAEQNGPIMMANADFLERWSGTLVLCGGRTAGEADQPFDLRWFLPEVFRHKRYLKDVAIAALLSSVIAYSMPLMFQILLDKVVSHRSYQTLFTITLVFLTLAIFDGLFNYTRQYLMLMVTSKIDAQLAARTFRKLLQLPMSFFESTTAGVLTKNMLQTETIRNFLTSRVFQTALDSLILPVTIVILFLYSAKLAAIVLGFSSLIALIIGLMLPLFRRNLEQLIWLKARDKAIWSKRSTACVR